MKKVSLLMALSFVTILGNGCLYAKDTDDKEWEERQARKAWLEKKRVGLEKFDQRVTSFMYSAAFANCAQTNISRMVNSITGKFVDIPLLTASSQKWTALTTAALFTIKIPTTLYRMKLHNHYVGLNPLRLIPAVIQFSTIDLLSWH